MNSRAKGARGELEVAHAYQQAGYPQAHRAGQMQAGLDCYADVIVPELPWLHIEAKRAERWQWDWLDQTVSDAGARLPVLHFRRNTQPWWVSLPLDRWLPLVPALCGHLAGEDPH